jgi:hypothetical protein
VWNGVEVPLEVRIHHPRFTCCQQLIHPPQRIFASSPRTKAVAVLGEVPFKDRFDDQPQRALHDPIVHARHPQRPLLAATGFVDPHSPHRLGLIGGLSQLLFNGEQPLLAVWSESFHRHAIHSGTASVGSHLFPGPRERAFRPDLIDQGEPHASFNPLCEGLEHALCPHPSFHPRPAGAGFSLLFSRWRHCRGACLLGRFHHAFTFLRSLAPRGLAASSLL